MKTKLFNLIIFICGLLFWWQARYFISDNYFNNAPFELGRVSLYLSQFIILLASVGFIINWHRDGSKLFFNKKWYISYLFLLIYLFARTVFGEYSLLNYSIFFQWLLLLLFVFALAHQSTSDKKILVYGLITGGVILSIWTWFQWLFQAQFASSILGVASHLPDNLGSAVVVDGGKRIMRAYAGMAHPNILGGYLTMLILLFFSQKTILVLYKNKVIEYAIIILLSSGLMLTFSRSAIIGLFAGILLLVIRKDFVKYNFKNILLMFFTCLLMFFSYHNLYLSRITQTNSLENKSVNERIGGYDKYFKSMSNKWLFGFGFSGYQEELKSSNKELSGYDIQPIHNSLLFLVAQIGVAGLLLVLIFIFLSSINSALIVALFVIALFDYYLVGYYFGIILLGIPFIDLRRTRF